MTLPLLPNVLLHLHTPLNCPMLSCTTDAWGIPATKPLNSLHAGVSFQTVQPGLFPLLVSPVLQPRALMCAAYPSASLQDGCLNVCM